MDLPHPVKDLVRKLVNKEGGPDHLIMAVLYEDMAGSEALKTYCKSLGYDIEKEYLQVQINLKIVDSFGNTLPIDYDNDDFDDDDENSRMIEQLRDPCFEENPHIVESEFMNIFDYSVQASGFKEKPVLYEADIRHMYNDPDEPIVDMSWCCNVIYNAKPTLEDDCPMAQETDNEQVMDVDDVSDIIIQNVYSQLNEVHNIGIVKVEPQRCKGIKRKRPQLRSKLCKQKFRKLVLGAPRGNETVRSDCLVVDRRVSARTKKVLASFRYYNEIEEVSLRSGKHEKVAFFTTGSGEMIVEYNQFLCQILSPIDPARSLIIEGHNRSLTSIEKNLGLEFDVGPSCSLEANALAIAMRETSDSD